MAKATYNPSKTGAGITLSSGNRIATWTTSSDKHTQLQFYRNTGKYWLEFELQTGSNVPFHTVGMGNASALVTNYMGANANSKGVFEDSVRGTWKFDYNGSTTTIGSGPQMAVGSVMCLYVDCDNRKFFVYVHNGTTGQWIGDDPNITPAGGFPWSFTGDGAPGYGKFHSLGGALLRTAAQFTMTGVMPSGATQEWDDAAAAGGAMVGAASLSLGAAGTLTGPGALAGVASLALVPAGQLRGAGALVGTASCTLTAAATGTLTGQLVGNAALSLTAAGTLAGAGAAVGNATLSLSATGALDQPGLEGNATLSLAASGTLAGTGALVGSATLAITPSATLAAAGALSGTVPISLATAGALQGNAALVGTAGLSLAAEAEASATGALEGTAAVQVAATGALSANGVVEISGTASLAIAASGSLGAVASIAGQASISIAPSATLVGTAELVGNAPVSITASGAGNLLGVLNGNALIAVAIVGELLGRAALVGNAGLSLTAHGRPYTDDADLIPIVGIRPDSSGPFLGSRDAGDPLTGNRIDSFDDGPANRPHDAIEPGQRPGAIAVIAER